MNLFSELNNTMISETNRQLSQVDLIKADLSYLSNQKKHDKIITKREVEVLYLISEGHTTHHIADILHISTETVSTHRKTIIRKFRAKTTPHLIGLAKDLGLI